MELSKVIHHLIDWSRIDDNSIIVDAGASSGDTLKLIREKTNCLICAIEPDRDAFWRMIYSSLDFTKLYLEKKYAFSNKALTSNSSEDVIDFYNGDTNGSCLKHLYSYIKSSKIKSLKVKDLFNEFGIDYIDWLKVNIVGNEKEVFDDMSQEMADKIYQLSVQIYFTQQRNIDLVKLMNDRLTQLGFKTTEFYNGMEIYAYREKI